ncbi:hypothetical protein JS756_08735 [Streptomyces actuosus]|uniref:Uncharacterized protein n=1 Tax=Streptomyces actuosus TaxID=1885 RepID=A0ABS2VM76_STRAS|nr:hypothetical protein [Streptomyces actuosus]MBN0044192.1 hypothetical protein [Streptomyces actuosus]
MQLNHLPAEPCCGRTPDPAALEDELGELGTMAYDTFTASHGCSVTAGSGARW